MANALAQRISDTDTTIPVVGPIQNAPNGGVVQIGSEKIFFGHATDTLYLDCIRGFDSTSAAVHAVGSVVTNITDSLQGAIIELTGSAAPVDGITGAGLAPAGSRYTRTSNGTIFTNTGTSTSPVWTLLQAGTDNGITQLTGDVTAGPGNGSQAATLSPHSVTPSKVSNVGTDDFLFPRDITFTRFLQIASNLLQIGTLDAFSRTQIWNKMTSAILRLGADTADGDSSNVDSEGIVVYKPSLDQLGRMKADRFGLTKASDSSKYYFRVDGTSLFYSADQPSTPYFFIDRSTGAIGIGTGTPDTSAIVDISSTVKGFLPPRMTTTQRNAISSPADGLLVYDTTLFQLWQYQNGAWAEVGGGGAVTPNVVSFLDTVGFSTTSNLYQTTLTAVTITASSNTAAIKISVSGGMGSANPSLSGVRIDLLKDGGSLTGGAGLSAFFDNSGTLIAFNDVPASFVILDIPGDTSPHVYAVAIKNDDGLTEVRWLNNGGFPTGSIIAEEVH